MNPDGIQHNQPESKFIDGAIPPSGISPQRRAAMLSLLQQAARDNCRRRRIRRRWAVIAPAITILTGAGLWWLPREPARDGSVVTMAEDPVTSAASQDEVSPAAPGPENSRPAGIAVDRIDDDELLDMLSAIGRPAGLARINGRVEVVAMENPPSDQP